MRFCVVRFLEDIIARKSVDSRSLSIASGFRESY